MMGRSPLSWAWRHSGVADTLGISEEELGFGSTVEITGDAKKFAPEDMMTVVTNDFFQDIDTSELNAGNLDSQIDQLDSAAKQLAARLEPTRCTRASKR